MCEWGTVEAYIIYMHSSFILMLFCVCWLICCCLIVDCVAVLYVKWYIKLYLFTFLFAGHLYHWASDSGDTDCWLLAVDALWQAVEDAFVPVIKMTFDGIEVCWTLFSLCVCVTVVYAGTLVLWSVSLFNTYIFTGGIVVLIAVFDTIHTVYLADSLRSQKINLQFAIVWI